MESILVNMSMNETWVIHAATGQRDIKASLFGKRSLLSVPHEPVEQVCSGDLPTEDI